MWHFDFSLTSRALIVARVMTLLARTGSLPRTISQYLHSPTRLTSLAVSLSQTIASTTSSPHRPTSHHLSPTPHRFNHSFENGLIEHSMLWPMPLFPLSLSRHVAINRVKYTLLLIFKRARLSVWMTTQGITLHLVDVPMDILKISFFWLSMVIQQSGDHP